MGNIEKTELTVMCMICDGTKILVQDRVNKDWPGVTFPGGHVEAGEAFTDAVRRVSLMSNKISPVQIKVDAESGTVTLVTTSQDVGNAQENLICEVEGDTVDIAFNYAFMLDGLNSIPTDVVYLELFGPMKPGILRAAEGADFLYLIMPVRV